MSNIYTSGNSFSRATTAERSGEAEYTEYINTQVSKDNEWKCASLLHKAADKGYPEAVAEYNRVRRSEILGQIFASMMYAPFFGLLITIVIVVVLLVTKIDLPIDLLILYSVVVYVLLPLIYLYNTKYDPWIK